MKALQCSAISPNHSDDRMSVYHGAIEPIYVCGFHGHKLSPADYRTTRQAGVIA